jgi:hypothetical protein
MGSTFASKPTEMSMHGLSSENLGRVRRSTVLTALILALGMELAATQVALMTSLDLNLDRVVPL